MTPEQQVLRHLAEEANAKRKVKRLKRRPPPVFATVLLITAVAAGITGAMMPNVFDALPVSLPTSLNGALKAFSLQDISLPGGIKIGFLGQAKAQTPNQGAAKKKEESAPKAKSAASPAGSTQVGNPESAAAEGVKSTDANLDLRQWSAEELSFFKRLNERKLELDRREAELVKLEEELQSQRVGIEEKIKQLEATRTEISATLKGRVEQDQEKVAKLVDVYSNMKPVSASRVIESLNEDLAVTILDKMKKKNAAEILNMMNSEKARKLSEMLTGYRQPASVEKADGAGASPAK